MQTALGSDLDDVDVENALLHWHKFEVDDVSQRPQRVVGQEHGD